MVKKPGILGQKWPFLDLFWPLTPIFTPYTSRILCLLKRTDFGGFRDTSGAQKRDKKSFFRVKMVKNPVFWVNKWPFFRPILAPNPHFYPSKGPDFVFPEKI